jgi:uncharacterized membrane protein YgcG
MPAADLTALIATLPSLTFVPGAEAPVAIAQVLFWVVSHLTGLLMYLTLLRIAFILLCVLACRGAPMSVFASELPWRPSSIAAAPFPPPCLDRSGFTEALPARSPALGRRREHSDQTTTTHSEGVTTMTKAAIIISAILVFAGIAAAGTLSSSGGSNSPTISTPTLQTTTSDDVRQEDRRADDAQGVEDVSGPCDEAEHANDPRCTGAATGAQDDDQVDDNGHHGQNSGHGGEPGDDNGGSGHGGGNSGHGGGDDD